MNPFLPTFIVLLIATVAVLIALFSRRATTPGLSEIVCLLPDPQGSAD